MSSYFIAPSYGAGIPRQGSDPPVPPGPVTLIGGSGFDTTNLLQSPNGGGYRGNTSGFTIAVLCKIDTQVASGHLFCYIDGSGKGYRIYQNSGTTIRMECGNLAGNAFENSPSYSPAADIGKVVLLVGVHTGTAGQISFWAGDKKVGGDTEATGYSLPSLSLPNAIGHRNNGTAAHTGATIFAVGGWNRALTNAEIHTLHDTVRSTGKLPTGIANTAMICNVADDAVGASFPAVLTDQVGSADFDFVAGDESGIVLETVTTPEWAWSDATLPPTDVWLGVGDSEMSGRGKLSEAEAGYPPEDGSLLMFKSVALGFQTLEEPCGDGVDAENGVGPMGLFGWLVAQETGRVTAIINAGKGGSTTTQWLPGTANYADAVARAQVALSRRNTTFRGFGAYIGANDAALVDPTVFEDNWSTTMTAMRAAIGSAATGKPIAIVKLPPTVPTEPGFDYSEWANVNADIDAFVALSADHLSIAAEDGPWREAYNLHLKTVANYAIAGRMLTAVMAHGTWE